MEYHTSVASQIRAEFTHDRDIQDFDKRDLVIHDLEIGFHKIKGVLGLLGSDSQCWNTKGGKTKEVD